MERTGITRRANVLHRPWLIANSSINRYIQRSRFNVRLVIEIDATTLHMGPLRGMVILDDPTASAPAPALADAHAASVATTPTVGPATILPPLATLQDAMTWGTPRRGPAGPTPAAKEPASQRQRHRRSERSDRTARSRRTKRFGRVHFLTTGTSRKALPGATHEPTRHLHASTNNPWAFQRSLTTSLECPYWTLALQQVGGYDDVDDVAATTPTTARTGGARDRHRGTSILGQPHHTSQLCSTIEQSHAHSDSRARGLPCSPHALSRCLYQARSATTCTSSMAPGKRSMLMFGGHLNAPMCDPMPNDIDHHVGGPTHF